MNQKIEHAIKSKFLGRKTLGACSSCHQLRMHRISQKLLVTPEVLIIMINGKPQVNFTAEEMKSLETLNNDLISRAAKYSFPDTIMSSDFENIYNDEYRRLKGLMKEQMNMTQPTPDSVNKILSPGDNFSLKDHDEFNISAFEAKLDLIYDNTTLNNDSIESLVDLETVVDT